MDEEALFELEARQKTSGHAAATTGGSRRTAGDIGGRPAGVRGAH
jgi:hypothetical protein